MFFGRKTRATVTCFQFKVEFFPSCFSFSRHDLGPKSCQIVLQGHDYTLRGPDSGPAPGTPAGGEAPETTLPAASSGHFMITWSMAARLSTVPAGGAGSEESRWEIARF